MMKLPHPLTRAHEALRRRLGRSNAELFRAKAQKALGAKFSLKEFHNAVLQTANVPLAVREQAIDEYIAIAR